ncbi:MAG: L,D-transpeptidase family protein [Verrucomicrobiota bacterium]
MATFSRGQSRWKMDRSGIPVTVGQRGLGWGIGLHPGDQEGPQKREGDHRAPAGVYLLEFGFGAAAFREKGFPFRQVFDRDRWVDDPASRFYNQWVVEGDSRFPQDWNSAEIMKREDGLYDYVIVVGHNRNPILPGRGSAIFLHSWRAPGKSTVGCTAMETEEVKRLLQWLKKEANPILIQLPSPYLNSIGISAPLRKAIERVDWSENKAPR